MIVLLMRMGLVSTKKAFPSGQNDLQEMLSF